MLIETVKALCPLFGPSGCEDEVRDAIRKQAEPYADQLNVTPQGTLLLHKKGRTAPKKTVMLSAHMDEPGLMVRRITEDGFLRFSLIGDLDRRTVLGKKVSLGDRRIPGVIGMKPIHLTEKEERERIPKEEDLYIDIGAYQKDRAEAMVEAGSFGCFDGGVAELQNGCFRAKALASRAVCGILLELLKQELPIDLWFAFTVQKELGSNGAFGAAYQLHPEIALVLDGATAELPDPAGKGQACVPGGGPVIVNMDRRTIYDRELSGMLRQVAEEKHIPCQTGFGNQSSTDARAIQTSLGGSRVCGLSVPIRSLCTPACICSGADLEATMALTAAFLEKLEEQYE